MFSGGDFSEVARWLEIFLASHAKRESPRIEAVVEANDSHPNRYTVWLRLDARSSPRVELDFKTVADNRGSLRWCRTFADQVRSWARDLFADHAAPAREPERPRAGLSE